eukprot:1217548-Amphidinium_carterae.1
MPRDGTTTGYYGVMLLMTLCDEVHAYGFPDTPLSANSSFHYYGLTLNENVNDTASTNSAKRHNLLGPHEKSLYVDMALNADVRETDVAVLP